MKLDSETCASLARGHHSMWPRHRVRPVKNGMGETVGYLCHGVDDFEPRPVDWALLVGQQVEL